MAYSDGFGEMTEVSGTSKRPHSSGERKWKAEKGNKATILRVKNVFANSASFEKIQVCHHI